MKNYDLMELAGRNLRESVLRNGLTTLGISVGIASLVAMLSLGAGLQQIVGRRLNSSGLFDTVYVTSRRDMRNLNRERRQSSDTTQARALDDGALAEISRMPDVAEVYPDVRFATEIAYGDKSTLTVVAGIPLSDRRKEAYDEVKGKFFSSDMADEMLVQEDYAKDLSPDPSSLIGKQVTLHYAERDTASASEEAASASADESGAGSYTVVPRERQLTIVGIVPAEAGAGFRGPSARALIPVRLATSLHILQPTGMRSDAADTSYAALVVRADNPKRVQEIEDKVKGLGFTPFSLLDVSKNLRRLFAVLDLFLGIFGSLALAVASLGIINTLVMAILERRHEIGIMKAIGASDADVKTLFFTEAGVMGVAGGAVGVLLGWGIGRLINFATQIYLRYQQLPAEDVWLVPWWLILLAIGFAVLVSLLAGLYPAARAAKLDPVQALRYE